MVGVSVPGGVIAGLELLISTIRGVTSEPLQITGISKDYLHDTGDINDLTFRFEGLPIAPSGWTLKGRIAGIVYAMGAHGGSIGSVILRNTTDNTDVVETGTHQGLTKKIVRSVLFTIPAADKDMKLQGNVAAAAQNYRFEEAWVELLIVKD